MKYIDDLSFSNITNIIQGEEVKGGDVLNSLALEMEDTEKKIKKLEHELNCAIGRREGLIDASKKVLKHLNKEFPLAVKRQNHIVVVTEKYISIERNVI